MHHPVWNLLFHNPEFWDHLTKLHMCCLLGTCKEFRTSIPEREVLLRIFKDTSIKKVELFRLFPLTVHDVLKLRSPVRFTDAFQIAERKAHGFQYCMAVIREKGWRLWCERSRQHAECKQAIEELLRSNGAVSFQSNHPVIEKASKIKYPRVIVWKYTWNIIPTQETQRHNLFYYHQVLMAIQGAFGYWYKGIHKDTRTAIGAINTAMEDPSATEYVHMTFANAILAIGVVEFRRMPP